MLTLLLSFLLTLLLGFLFVRFFLRYGRPIDNNGFNWLGDTRFNDLRLETQAQTQ
ncbi:uncharacterized protein METZ01_LOCUS503925 [marine metagenome]|uniref:Uncharacterized protein n=1 Tax=marine metagenome TaxID=408172 RepID=A0A383E2X5_9ZZZZ